MAFRLSILDRNAGVNGLTSLFNKGSNPSTSSINIYSNATSESAAPESGVPGGSVVLVNIPFSGSAFLPASGGIATASGLPLQSYITNTGTAGWFSLIDGEASPVILGVGTVTVTGASGDLTFNSVGFISGGLASITNLTLSIPM